MMEPREIKPDELEALALGTGILGTGGGTHPYLELLNLKKLQREKRRIRVVAPDSLQDDALVAEIGFMGAPLISKERLPDPSMLSRALVSMERFAGVRFSAVMSSEIGGENGLAPMTVAALHDLPIIDADPRGRAFPEMQMSSFVIAGLPLYPTALADVRKNDMIIAKSQNAGWTERIGRKLCVETGSVLATCRPPRTGRQIKDSAIHGSISRAIRLGASILDARREHGDPIEAIIKNESATLLFDGKVVDVERRTAGGFVRGSTKIAATDKREGSTLTIDFQNEFSLARFGDEVLAMVPDLICVLDRATGEAVGTETIRYGMRVAVLVLDAPAALKTSEALRVVGPKAFGYDMKYRPHSGYKEKCEVV